MRTAREIREEIEARFGFFPPFFTPAEDTPLVLENLWQQTLRAYVENPLPVLFREKLFAWLSRYCAVPYCIVCHSCALRPLGMKSSQVLELLESLPPAHGAIDEALARMDALGKLPTDWPEPGSALEEDLFRCSVFLFVHQAERCRERVRRLLHPVTYVHLTAFLAYVKTCHLWVEAHPELSYEADQRAREHLGPLLREEPRLGDFFAHYGERVRTEREQRERELLDAADAGQRAQALSETLSQQARALRESEAHLRLALESAALGTWDFKPRTGELYWDARCKALMGLPEDEAVELDYVTFLSTIHPEDRAGVDASVQRALAPGGDGEYSVEFRTRGRRDGVVRWLASRGRCFFDAQGRPERFRGTVMDVTERRRMEDNLRFLAEASALLATSLDYEDILRHVATLAVPVLADWCGVDVVDERGQVRRLITVHREPAKVRLVEELFRRFPRDPNASAGIPRVLRTGEPELVPELTDEALARYTRDAEQLRMLRELGLRSSLAVALRSRGRVLGALSLVRAESGQPYGQAELRLAEELARRAAVAVDNSLLYREAQKAIGLREGFLQVAAHELRTPVTALKLNTQALVSCARREEAWSERTVSRLMGLERGVGRLGVLVDELLDVSRITSGRLVLQPEELDLTGLVREVAERSRPEAERAGCALRVRVPGPVVGRWDRLRLEQVLSNLLSNALKYGAGHPVEVALESTGERVRLRVRDEGIGIDAAEQARIFERFERAVSDRHYGGLGMGLWITREILSAMGGTIHVESAPGMGATFTVELPRS